MGSIEEFVDDFIRRLDDDNDKIQKNLFTKDDLKGILLLLCKAQEKGNKKERPIVLNSITEKSKTPFGSLYLTAGHINNEIYECFIKLGKSGSDIAALIEAIARLISVGIQEGISIDKYISTLDGITGKEIWDYVSSDGEKVTVYSVPDLIAKVLKNLKEKLKFPE